MDSRAGRRGWLIASVAALLTTLAGIAAIVHYSGVGPAIATGNGSVVAISKHSGNGAAPRVSASGRSADWSPPAAGHTPPARHRAGTAPAPASSPPPAGGRAPAAPVRFGTLPPRAKLPSGAQCARWVRARPIPEIRPANRVYNHTTGQHVGRGFLAFDGAKAVRLSRRIDGAFTGTTQQILRWAACKWGMDQNLVFAQAAIESWWRQTTLGDWGTDPGACPPHHGLGVDGRPGLCPQSWGILQNRYPYEKLSWPGIGKSTAMNADTAYAIWRACFDGYETWLNTVPGEGRRYHGGDTWGCIGRWFSGRWHTPAAEGYIKAVRKYLVERIWLTPSFKHG